MTAFGIHELRKQAHEENPDADYNDIVGRTRDRVVGAVKSANLGERASKLKLPEVRRPDGGGAGGASGGEAAGSSHPPSPEDARLDRLERLASLHEKGILNDEELAAEKARLLNADV
jgi:hypothetical protein